MSGLLIVVGIIFVVGGISQTQFSDGRKDMLTLLIGGVVCIIVGGTLI